MRYKCKYAAGSSYIHIFFVEEPCVSKIPMKGGWMDFQKCGTVTTAHLLKHQIPKCAKYPFIFNHVEYIILTTANILDMAWHFNQNVSFHIFKSTFWWKISTSIINIWKFINGWQHHSIINEYNRGCLLWCNEVYYDAICSWNDGLSISKAHLGTQLIIIPLEALELRAGWLDIGGYDHIL